MSNSATPWTAAYQISLSFTISLSLLKLMSTELVMLSKHLSLCCPFSFYPQSFCASGLFQRVGPLHQAAKVLESFNISPSNEYSVLYFLLSKGLSRVFSSTTVWRISSSVLSLLYGPTLTSMHNYRKNHSFDYTDLCWQSDVSAFQYAF